MCCRWPNAATSSWPATGRPPAQPALPLHGDADLLAVLLRNLVDNAVRYAPEGSTVTLRFAADGLEVHNAGPALAAEALARLGERFHRADGQAESGSGLGVSIVQRIAALHGLVLRYRSGSDGSGVVAALAAPARSRLRQLSAALTFASSARTSSRRPVSAICRPGRGGACSARSR